MKHIAILLTAVLLFLTGCAAQKKKILTEPAGSIIQYNIAGLSVQKRPISYAVLGSGKNVYFYMAAIHGYEYQGIALMEKLISYLKAAPQIIESKTVVIVFAANPDGVAMNQRFNANGIDLNRNFPAANRINNNRFGKAALCEPESKIIYNLLQKYQPKIIVSMHQSVYPRAGKLPAWIDYDGEAAKPLAEKMAELSNLPLRKYGAMPGSLGSYASTELGTPVITFEQFYEIPYDAEKHWQLYKDALLEVLNF